MKEGSFLGLKVSSWKWISKNLDVILLIPFLLFCITAIFGLFNLSQKYDYLSATINFTATLGIFYLINNAVERKKFRIMRIILAIIISAFLIYASINFPAFGNSP